MEAPTRRPSSSLGRLLAWAAIVVLAFYFVFLGGGWVGIHSVDLRTTTTYLVAGMFAVWAVVMIRRPAWQPRSHLTPAFVVALAVFAIGTVLSRQPRLGLDYLAYAVLLTGLYLLLVRLLADPWFRPRMLNLFVLLAAIIGAWYVQAVVAKWIEWWGLVGHLAPPPLRPEFEYLTFGNPSAVLTMSVLLTIPAVVWIGAAARGRAIATAALIVLCLVVSLLSGSRAGWLAMAVAIWVTGAAWLAVAENRASVARLIRSRAIRLGLAGGAVAAAVVGVAFLPGILSRAGAGGEGLRLSFVTNALQMFSESPIHGTGPGTWVAQRVAYTPPTATDYYIPHAHNVVAQTLAEFGLLGIAAGAFAAILVGGLVLRAIRSGDPRRRLLGWGTVLAGIYFATHNLLDFYPSLPPALFAFAIPIAWLDATNPGEANPGPSPNGRARWAIPAVGAVAIAVSTGWLLWSESQAAIHDRAVVAINAGRYDDALPDARAAVAADPGIAAYHLTLGLAAENAGHADEAADAFRQAAALDDLPDAWLGLADAEIRLGDQGAARDAVHEALRVGFQQPAIIVPAAGLLNSLGEKALANDALEEALVLAPSLGSDPTFRALIDGDPAVVIDRAIADLGGSTSAVELALRTGETDKARQLAAQLGGNDREVMALVIKAWDRDATAKASLETFAHAHPFDDLSLGWTARFARRDGDVAAADGFERWANLTEVYSGSGFRDMAINTGPPDPSSTVGSSAGFYGHYTYRRPTPWNLIPIDLPQLTWR